MKNPAVAGLFDEFLALSGFQSILVEMPFRLLTRFLSANRFPLRLKTL